jgi:hypothetical protein
MNRVWKQFLKNLAWPVGIAVYVWSVIALAIYVEKNIVDGGAYLVALLFIALPTLVYLIRDMWLDAKRKVEWENEQMMRTLKGD